MSPEEKFYTVHHSELRVDIADVACERCARTITLYCPIQVTPITPSTFYMTYWDSDGTSTNVQVAATAYKQNRTTGAITAIATLNSNNNAATSVNQMSLGISGLDTWDTSTNYFYIRVDLIRNSTSGQTAVFYGATIQ